MTTLAFTGRLPHHRQRDALGVPTTCPILRAAEFGSEADDDLALRMTFLGVRMGVRWREMEVVNLPSGQPTLRLTGSAERRLASLTPPGMRARVHLTLTDEYPLAQAQVIIEAIAA